MRWHGDLLCALIVASIAVIGNLPVAAGTDEAGSLAGPPPSRSYEWLLMVYMAADNTLGENGEWGNAAAMDIDEMEATIQTEGTRVLVLADMKGGHNTALYDIVWDNAEGQIASPTIPLSEVNSTWTDEIRSSDWQALRDFIVYSTSTTEALYSMLVIWDHGSGWQAMRTGAIPPGRSVAQDVTDGGIMDLKEMRQALAAADSVEALYLDILSFDACYMGNMEVFHQVSPWAHLCITSEDEQPFYGFNYSYVSRMGSQVAYTPAALATSIVSDFSNDYSNASDYPYSSMTVADLGVLREGLASSLDMFSRELWGWMYEMQVRSPVQFDNIAHGAEQVGYAQYDLGDMLRILGSTVLPGNLTLMAGAVKADYDAMIFAEYHVPGGRNPMATGTTIYLPTANLTYYNPIYDGSSGYLSLTADTYWDEMIREMCQPMERMRLSVNATSLDPDRIFNDLEVKATDPTAKAPEYPISDVRIDIPGFDPLFTGPSGKVVFRDMSAGRYDVIGSKDLLRAKAWAKVLNLPPVLRYTLDEERAQEGVPFVIDASSSYDPDGDDIEFGWDLNVSDGLGYTDSVESHIVITKDRPGEVTVGLRVRDTIESAYAQISFWVDNVAPVARLQVPGTVLEDEVFTADASGSYDTSPDDEYLEYSFEIDGTAVEGWSSSPYLRMSIPDRGQHEVAVLVRDDQAVTSRMIAGLTVFNEPPSAWIESPTTAVEDEAITFKAHGSDTASDFGDLVYSWTFTGSQRALSTGPVFNTSFPDSGTFNITLEVLDDDLSIGYAYAEVQVLNVDPIPSFDVPSSVLEAEPVRLDASQSHDTSSDMSDLRFEWDLEADGSVDVVGIETNVSFTSPGPHRVRLVVTDDDGSSSSLDKEVLVVNAGPRPEIAGPEGADEDEVLTFAITADCDTPNDEATLRFVWYLDGIETEFIGREMNASFSTEGPHSVDVSVSDDQGSLGNDTLQVTVRNVAPVARMLLGSTSVQEGRTLRIAATGCSDTPSDNDTLLFIWSIDGKVVLQTRERTAGIVLDDPGVHFIELRAVDDEGAEGEDGPIEIIVEERREMTPLFLIAAITMILSAIVAAVVIGRKVRKLPPIDVPEEEAASPNAETPDVTAEEDPMGPVGPVPGPVEEQGPAVPEPPEIEAPAIDEAPRSDPPGPVPVDPDLFK